MDFVTSCIYKKMRKNCSISALQYNYITLKINCLQTPCSKCNYLIRLSREMGVLQRFLFSSKLYLKGLLGYSTGDNLP